MRSWGPGPHRHSAGKLSSNEASRLWAGSLALSGLWNPICQPCALSGSVPGSQGKGALRWPCWPAMLLPRGVGPTHWLAILCFWLGACSCETGRAAWPPGSPPAGVQCCGSEAPDWPAEQALCASVYLPSGQSGKWRR